MRLTGCAACPTWRAPVFELERAHGTRSCTAAAPPPILRAAARVLLSKSQQTAEPGVRRNAQLRAVWRCECARVRGDRPSRDPSLVLRRCLPRAAAPPAAGGAVASAHATLCHQGQDVALTTSAKSACLNHKAASWLRLSHCICAVACHRVHWLCNRSAAPSRHLAAGVDPNRSGLPHCLSGREICTTQLRLLRCLHDAAPCAEGTYTLQSVSKCSVKTVQKLVQLRSDRVTVHNATNAHMTTAQKARSHENTNNKHEWSTHKHKRSTPTTQARRYIHTRWQIRQYDT